MKKYKQIVNIVIVLLSLTIISICNMGYPLILKDLVDSALVSDFDLVRQGVLLVVIITIVTLITELTHKIFRIKYITDISGVLQKKFLTGIMNMESEIFFNKNTSQYTSMFNNDLSVVIQSYYDEKINLYFSILSSIVGIIAIFNVNYVLALITIISSMFPLVIPMIFKGKLSQKRKKTLIKLENLNLKLKDFLSGFDLIKSFNIEKYVKSKFNKEVNETLKVNYDYARLESIMEITVGGLSFISNICLIVVGTILIFNKTITAGALLACFQISDLLISPILNISIQLNSINSTKKIKEELDIILNTKKEITDEKVTLNIVENIKLKDLSFSYGEKKVLSKINYNFKKDKKYAIVGESGSGKSTLLNIINKKYLNYNGNVMINNCNIKSIDDIYYHKLISMIHQNTFIFNDNIINNITLFKSYQENKVKETFKRSCLDTFLEYDNAYSFECVNDGSNLSGGEKQKIALARALINNSTVLLLDEVTASLDKLNHIKIKEILLGLESTMIIDVTHKLESFLLKKYDEILVMDNGEIFENGTYDELIRKKGLFYRMINEIQS